jgi:hypothetical protein
MFRDQWQFKFKIIRYIIPGPNAFKEALEGLLLILSNWYRLYCHRRTPRTSRSMSVALISEGQ